MDLMKKKMTSNELLTRYLKTERLMGIESHSKIDTSFEAKTTARLNHLLFGLVQSLKNQEEILLLLKGADKMLTEAKDILRKGL